ncbi:MAG: hypothetical protein ACETWR_19710 [Anaerolineae bacterium]
MDTVNIITSIAGIVVGAIVSFFLAKYYGDVAGTKAAIEFEREKAAQAHIVALHALLNEIVRIRDLADHNSKLVRYSDALQSVVRLPVTAFETAFLSKESSLLAEDEPNLSEPMASVTAYLTEAYSIN